MGFTKLWWKQNRDKVLEKRRERYATDETYRNSVKDAVRRRRAATREAPKSPPTIVTDSGEYTGIIARDVLKETGLSYNQLRSYHKFGWLPDPLITKPRNLYTAPQLDWIKALGKFCRDNRNWMRQPNSPTGKNVRLQLDELVHQIKQNWNN